MRSSPFGWQLCLQLLEGSNKKGPGPCSTKRQGCLVVFKWSLVENALLWRPSIPGLFGGRGCCRQWVGELMLGVCLEGILGSEEEEAEASLDMHRLSFWLSFFPIHRRLPWRLLNLSNHWPTINLMPWCFRNSRKHPGSETKFSQVFQSFAFFLGHLRLKPLVNNGFYNTNVPEKNSLRCVIRVGDPRRQRAHMARGLRGTAAAEPLSGCLRGTQVPGGPEW